MNERELSRRLSTSVVDTLKAQGHVLVVKGGAQALARELEELMTPTLSGVVPRLSRGVVMGEVTSTFGDDAVDEAVEELVAKMTHALMDSDHVEDVFAEDNVIRRDVFRTVRDGIQRAQEADVAGEGDADVDETKIVVRLETLGYVAATVSKRADAATLRGALEQAAEIVEAELTAFAAETREATFTMNDAGPDARLDLEEAVADELTALVDDGLVDLPTIERVVDIGRSTNPLEQKQAQSAIEAVASKTLHRSGCAASWEFEGARSIRVTLTPLSDQDSRDVDQPVAMFARGVAAVFAAPVEAPPPPPPPPPRSEKPASSKKPASARAEVEAAPVSAKPRSSKGASKAEVEKEVAKPKKAPAKKAAAKSPASTKAPASSKAGAAKATKKAAVKPKKAAAKSGERGERLGPERLVHFFLKTQMTGTPSRPAT